MSDEEKEMTTIQILKSDGLRLDELKAHPKQPDREIITMLLDRNKSKK